MSLSESDAFTEKFALYLALGLLGPSRVIEYLNDDEREKRPAVPMYWRSKLMIPDPSRILYHVGQNADSTSTTFPLTKILFFDATFTFVKKVQYRREKDNKCDLSSTQRPSFPRVLVSLGFFSLLQKGFEAASEDRTGIDFYGGRYIPTEALGYEQIMSYINSLQVRLDSVDPEKLASSMAEEFLRQGSSSSFTAPQTKHLTLNIQQRIRQENGVLTSNYADVSQSCTGIEKEENGKVKNAAYSNQSQSFDDLSSNCEICVKIPCNSVKDLTGQLLLKYSPSGVMKFDGSALRFLSWDFAKNPNNFENVPRNGESLLSKKELVDEAFDQWQIQFKSSPCNDTDDNNSGKQRLENCNNPETLTAKVESNSTKTNNKHKMRRNLKGMGILPSARRKRNKSLVYDIK